MPYTRPSRTLPLEDQSHQELQFWTRQYQFGRWALERDWYRNLLFYLGHQWIRPDDAAHRWRVEELRDWIPRPVTNRLGCVDGETTIPCLDGTTPTIRDLAARNTPVWVYGFDRASTRIIPVVAERVWQTARTPCLRVEFREKTSVVCSMDHKFLTWTRGYVEAQDLRPGDSVVPCVVRPDGVYYRVMQPADVRWEPIHRLVWETVGGPIPAGHHIHHKDGRRSNNAPDNLEALSASAHATRTMEERYARGELTGTKRPGHAETMRRLWATPEYRSRLEAARLQSWQNAETRRQTVRERTQARPRDERGRLLANHRVTRIVPVGERDVYDLSTPATRNFAVGAGVFVHNSTVNVIRSAIINADPRFAARPRSVESDSAVSGARAADEALGIIYADSLFRRAKRNFASWLVLTGTAFLGIEFDSSPVHGELELPGEQCVTCGLQLPPSRMQNVCPECQGSQWLETLEVSERIPRGRMLTTSWSPFELLIDAGMLELEDQPALILSRSYHVEVARQWWPDQADKIQPTTAMGQSHTYLNTLATIAPGARGAPVMDHTIVRRIYRKPSKDWETGLAAVQTSDGVPLAQDRTYPFVFTHSERPFFPLVKGVYDEVPGRFWGKTPVSDLVPKQAQRNRIESLYELTLMTMAAPVWAIPVGSHPSKITGSPGSQFTYTPVGGQRPERIQGVGPDASVIMFLNQIDQDFEEIASTFSVMKGKQPGSIRAFQAMRLLEERGFGRFGSVFDNLEEVYERWGTVALEIWRRFAVTPLVQTSRTALGAWTQRQFLSSDLELDVDIRVEAGSVRPKSSLAKLDTMQRLQQMGAINPLYPEQRYRMLEEAGMLSMIPGVELDVERAMGENAEFMRWAVATQDVIRLSTGPEDLAGLLQRMPPPVELSLLIDEHITHFVHHRRLALTDAYQRLPKPLKEWWEVHQLAGHLDAYMQLLARGGAPGQMGTPFGLVAPPPLGGAVAAQPPPTLNPSEGKVSVG